MKWTKTPKKTKVGEWWWIWLDYGPGLKVIGEIREYCGGKLILLDTGNMRYPLDCKVIKYWAGPIPEPKK